MNLSWFLYLADVLDTLKFTTCMLSVIGVAVILFELIAFGAEDELPKYFKPIFG
jgi:hypothetical protein